MPLCAAVFVCACLPATACRLPRPQPSAVCFLKSPRTPVAPAPLHPANCIPHPPHPPHACTHVTVPWRRNDPAPLCLFRVVVLCTRAYFFFALVVSLATQVNLAQKHKDPIPGLLYEADVGGRDSNPGVRINHFTPPFFVALFLPSQHVIFVRWTLRCVGLSFLPSNQTWLRVGLQVCASWGGVGGNPCVGRACVAGCPRRDCSPTPVAPNHQQRQQRHKW